MVEMSTAVEQSNDIPHNDSCENIKGNLGFEFSFSNEIVRP